MKSFAIPWRHSLRFHCVNEFFPILTVASHLRTSGLRSLHVKCEASRECDPVEVRYGQTSLRVIFARGFDTVRSHKKPFIVGMKAYSLSIGSEQSRDGEVSHEGGRGRASSLQAYNRNFQTSTCLCKINHGVDSTAVVTSPIG